MISKEEYHLFRTNYMEKLSKLEESIQYRSKKQEDTKKKINQNKSWIIDLHQYKNLSTIDRLSIVMLIDKIFISEDKTIDIRFNHMEELSLLEEMAKSKVSTFDHNMDVPQTAFSNIKSNVSRSSMDNSLVCGEREVYCG